MSQSTTTGTRIIIIGAGWAGISAAKTYLEIARHLGRAVDLTVLDSGPAPGGVWNPSRLYPGLVAQGLNGFYEFSDLPMANDDHPWGSSITGEYVQEYCRSLALLWSLLLLYLRCAETVLSMPLYIYLSPTTFSRLRTASPQLLYLCSH